MDELVTFSCPACGANLEMEPGMQQAACQYCGSTHMLADLVSARSLTAIKTDAARIRLMRFFDFNKKDLEYNRQGRLSPRQERHFSTQGVTAFMLLFAVGIGGAMMSMAASPFHQPLLCSGIAIIVSIILGAIYYHSVVGPLRSGVVEMEVGTLRKPERMNMWKPVIHIGRKTFPVGNDPFKALEWNVPYKVYYSPVGNVILSIEPVNA